MPKFSTREVQKFAEEYSVFMNESTTVTRILGLRKPEINSLPILENCFFKIQKNNYEIAINKFANK